MGYRHFAKELCYLYHGKMYDVPPSENEFCLFTVDATSQTPPRSSDATSSTCVVSLPNDSITSNDSQSPPLSAFSDPAQTLQLTYPRGGHNYYGRDIEKLGRSMRWIDALNRGEEGWEERYLKKRGEWEKKWEKRIPSAVEKQIINAEKKKAAESKE
jgi:hypothetical protein